MSTLDKALKIIDDEIDKIATLSKYSKSEDGEDTYCLDRTHAGMLAEYVKVLISAQKNEREVINSEQLHTLSDEELEKLAKDALKQLQTEEKGKNHAKPRSRRAEKTNKTKSNG